MNAENEGACAHEHTPDYNPETLAKIVALNDRLRRTGQGGRFLLTQGIIALGLDFSGAVLKAVREFELFTPDNDPWNEHDCAALTVNGRSVIFKIDYYDLDFASGSPDPADPKETKRVLTVKLAEEY